MARGQARTPEYSNLVFLGKWAAPGIVTSLAFSPDQSYLAGATQGAITFWNDKGDVAMVISAQDQPAAGDPLADDALRRPLDHRAVIRQIVFSPDSKLIAAAYADSEIRLWNVASGKMLLPFYGHDKGGALCIAFSGDGKVLASGGNDQLVKLWDVQTGNLLRTLEGHEHPVVSLAVSRDGKMLRSLSVSDRRRSDNAEIRSWDMATRSFDSAVSLSEVDPATVILSPTGGAVGSTVAGTVHRTARVLGLWSAEYGDFIRSTQQVGEKPMTGLTFSMDGSRIIGLSNYKDFMIWDVRTGRRLLVDALTMGDREADAPPLMVSSKPLLAAFAPNNRIVAIGCEDRTVEIWATKQ